jgi:hypothetical protein
MQGEDYGYDQSEDGYPDDDWNRRWLRDPDGLVVGRPTGPRRCRSAYSGGHRPSDGLSGTQKPAWSKGPTDPTREPAGLASSDFPSAGPRSEVSPEAHQLR